MKMTFNKGINSALTSTILVATLATTPVWADDDAETKAQQNGLIGLGSGVVLGTIVAGPVGGAVAGIVGLLIAEDVNNTDKVERAELALNEAHQDLAKRDQQLISMQKQYDELEQKRQIQLVSMSQEIEKVTQDLETSIQFRTGSYGLEEHYTGQLDLIAEGLVDNQELQASLSGYADKRGEVDFNRALSEQRLITVKKYLLSKGVLEEQITTQAYGEEALVSKGENYEDDFFDRRVTIRLEKRQPVMTAAN